MFKLLNNIYDYISYSCGYAVKIGNFAIFLLMLAKQFMMSYLFQIFKVEN